ncbi:MAG: ComF family protein [Bacteroidaceae bacterium]|nr:ComF family protein [Bacteroidaceae bacterium]
MLMSLYRNILDFFFPRTCAACGKRLAEDEASLCVPCIRGLNRVGYMGNDEHGALERLFWGQLPIERTTSFFYYSGENHQNILHNLKYFRRKEVGRDVGALFAEELLESGFFEGIDGIVALPLHKKKQQRRGYNQCDYIAKGISDVTGIPIIQGVVERVVNNDSQTHRNRIERKENVEGIFRLKNADLVAGKHVLLVDDVLTTGSTLISCGKELAKAPGIRISICTLAYAGEFGNEK